MKKINWLIAVVAVVAAALLVMLYFALGFQHADNYLDVCLGILRVAIIAVFAGILYWRESVRGRLIRRFYISPATVYNPEFGGARRADALPQNTAEEFDRFAADVYAALEYGFEIADRPESYDPKYIVDTKRFQAHRDDDNKLVVDTREGSLSKYKVNEDGKEQIQEVAQYNDEYELVDALRKNQVFA